MIISRDDSICNFIMYVFLNFLTFFFSFLLLNLIQDVLLVHLSNCNRVFGHLPLLLVVTDF